MSRSNFFFLFFFFFFSPTKIYISSTRVFLRSKKYTTNTNVIELGRREREREKSWTESVINYIFPPTYFERYSVDLERHGGDPWNWTRTTASTRYEPAKTLQSARNSFFLSFLFFSFRADFSHFDLFHRERQWPFIGDAREFTRAWRERFIDFILAQCPTSMENLFFGTRIILRPSCATPTETHSRFLEPTMNRATSGRRKAETNSNSLCIVSQASAIDSVRT